MASPGSAATWPCATHGDRARIACSRCGKFTCGKCSAKGLCPECADARGRADRVRQRVAAIRRSVVLSLGIAALLYALPAAILEILRVRAGYDSDPVTYYFIATYAGLPALALLLVWLTKRFWVVVVAVPPLLFALPAIIALPRVGFTRGLVLAAVFVLFACARSIQGWWIGRGVPRRP